MARKEDQRVCIECAKYINTKKDKYVQVSTFQNSNIFKDEHVCFHFQCWIDYFNKRVELKARANVGMMQEQALKLFNNPMIKGIISQIKGGDMALNMASIPLSQRVAPKELVINKIQNDRKKRSGKKIKQKMQ